MRKQYLAAALASLAMLGGITASGMAVASRLNPPDAIPTRAALAPKHEPKHDEIVSTSMHVSARTDKGGFGVAVIHGCPAEDSCRPMYHPDGVWTIRPWVKSH